MVIKNKLLLGANLTYFYVANYFMDIINVCDCIEGEIMEQRIKELTKLGYSQRDIASILKISRDKVRYWQKKMNVKPKVDVLDKVCKRCSKSYHTTSNSEHSKFCSDKCRIKYYKETVLKERECKRCGKYFKTYKSQYCSHECRNNLGSDKLKQKYIPKPKHIAVCINCNKEYKTHRSKSKYCSYECSYEYKVKHKPIHNKKCKECSKWFSSTNNRLIFCSSVCGKKYRNREKETLRRKRIKQNGKVDWKISIERLMKRDKNICYLCGDCVDINLDPNHNYYPSIEHVIPVSKGGTHTWDNVKLAHRKCNYLKSNKVT